MEKKINYIIREVPPEHAYFNSYFDDDGLTSVGGENCAVYIVPTDRMYSGFNMDEYKEIEERAEAIIDSFHDVSDKWANGYNSFATYKEAMEYCDISYTSRKCHLLKEWTKTADTSDTDSIAEYLTITTGKEWTTDSAYGYYQSDCVKMVYCPEHYKDGVRHYGEVWLGAAKEFYTIDLDENGEETETCYGYIIADCQARTDEDYKRLVCEWAGIPEDETQLEMIDGSRLYTEYSYRTV